LEWLKKPDWKKVDNDLRWLEFEGHHCLTLQAQAYPQILGEIADPPPLLFVRGDVDALACRQIALVGSRNPSPGGEKLARDFSHALVETGFAVTSGLALGIDAAAHLGALDGNGLTVAVAGTGLDQVYPRRHQDLAEAIVGRGGFGLRVPNPHPAPSR
jgi:DNA processing protein